MPDATRLGGIAAADGDAWEASRSALRLRCPRLERLVSLAGAIPRQIPDPRPVTHLAVRTIVSQLVSTAAARTIVNRLLEAHGSFEEVVAWARQQPIDAPPTLGLSRAKRRAIGGWGDFVATAGDPRLCWANLEAPVLLAEIMALRGFGRWSAEMLAIFAFGHHDIWPDGDVAVVRVMRRLYPRRKPASIRARVAGHSSFAALCCWTVVDRGLEGEL